MNAKSYLKSHGISFLCLIPFLFLLWLHQYLGLSDAILMVRDQRDRDSQLFHLRMGIVFYFGVTAFLVHALALAHKSRGWLFAKLLFLIAYWFLALKLV
jgi:hypothetical protein